MSASLAEVQALADQILELLGTRIPSGQLVVHYDQGRVQGVETNQVFRPRPSKGYPQNGLDTKKGNGAG
jgi:hypothetical protein